MYTVWKALVATREAPDAIIHRDQVFYKREIAARKETHAVLEKMNAQAVGNLQYLFRSILRPKLRLAFRTLAYVAVERRQKKYLECLGKV